MYKIGKAINVSTKPNFEKIINYSEELETDNIIVFGFDNQNKA